MTMPNWLRAIGRFLRGKNGTSRNAAPVNDVPGRVRLAIAGMTCAGCERRIENALERVPGVKRVSASTADARADVAFDPAAVSVSALIAAIDGLGYQAGPEAAAAPKREGFSPLVLIGIGVIIVAAGLVLDRLGVFNALPVVTQSMGYGLLFVVGLITSVHCVAMCGGINLSQSSKGLRLADAPVRRRLIPGLLYNGGRLISYTVIGGLAGALGSAVSLSGRAQGVIVIVAGAFMLLMAVNMLNLFPALKKFTPRLPKALTGRLSRAVSGKGPFLVGLANGLMPCGPLQSVQLYALATGSFIAGAASMFLFALGTVPLMFGFGAVSSLLSRRWSARLLSVSALIVLVLGIAMIGRGMNLSGLTPSFATPVFAAGAQAGNIARVEGNVQTVSSVVTSSAYEPIVVQAGIPVRWTLKADAAELNGCNGSIIVPRYNVTKKLSPGDNLVEFVPDAAGIVPFTCWMGMISSSIKVVDDIRKVSVADAAFPAQNGAAPAAGGSCCAPGGGAAANGGTGGVPFAVSADGAVTAATRDGIQSARIVVDGNGYSPAVVLFRKGVKARLVFDGRQLTPDTYRMIVPAFGAHVEFKAGENVVEFTPAEDFYIENWTSLFYGAILVTDGPGALDRAAIETRIGRLEQASRAANASGSAGCCGAGTSPGAPPAQ